jgi:N-terminal acetyltransferase B complex non-catalytic subunit
MGCLRLYYKRSDETRYLLRCALILEFLIANSSHNYDAFLMLISSYLHLGAVSKAIKFYTKLEIKHIQNITNSWILFTRISTLHPHSLSRDFSAGKNLLNPADFLRGALSWALRNEAAAQAAVMKFMENDSLTNLLGYLKYSKISSLTPMMKKQYMIEIQRLSRLGHLNAAVDEDLLTGKSTV